MTQCLSHNFPPMYLKRNTTTRLLNLRTLLYMQLLTYETVFEYIVWPIRRTVRRVHCKKRQNFLRRFDLQCHARAQIFTYKDVSVCNVSTPNFHMFYHKRRVSTQISRLCHVHAQVHTLWRIWASSLIAFHRSGACGGAEVRRAARLRIVFDDFINLAFPRGIGATRPAGGVCRSVRRTWDGHARSSRVRRDGRGGARAPSPPSVPFS